MMGERGGLKFTYDRGELDLLGDMAGVRIHKADPPVLADRLGKLGDELQHEEHIGRVFVRQYIVFRTGRERASQPFGQPVKHMPGDAIVLAIHVPIPQDQGRAEPGFAVQARFKVLTRRSW